MGFVEVKKKELERKRKGASSEEMLKCISS